jgi:hypothetical protein
LAGLVQHWGGQNVRIAEDDAANATESVDTDLCGRQWLLVAAAG